MRRAAFAALFSFLVPVGALAAHAPSFFADRSLVVASSSPGNAYAAGASVVITAPVGGDLSAIGGSIITTAPVTGDAVLLGGSVSTKGPVAGDMRAAGGSVNVEDSVGGDFVAFGYSVVDTGRPKGAVFIAAADASLAGGAGGPVTIYGNNVSLAGNFAGDVTVIASGRLIVAPDAAILGKLSYQAPEAATVASSTTIAGGVAYASVSYLPGPSASHALEVAGIGLFLFVRVLGALLLAGLLAGLFPHLAESVVALMYAGRARSTLLTTLLGFAVFSATPILSVLLLFTFIGIGLALLLLIAYAFIVLLAFVYAGILLGGILARRVWKRDAVRWHDGVLGMLVLSLIAFIPIAGTLVVLLLAFFAAGALTLLFFRNAFSREWHTDELV